MTAKIPAATPGRHARRLCRWPLNRFAIAPCASSVQPRLKIADALGDERFGRSAVSRLDQYRLGRRNGDVGGCGADISERLRLCLSDLGFRHLGAAGDELLDLRLGLRSHAVSFDTGIENDRFGGLFGLPAGADIRLIRLRPPCE